MNKGRSPYIIAVFGLCLLLIAAGLVFLKKSGNRQKDLNIIIICLDTLRADHVSSLGYHRQTTPNIDELLAAKGVLFKQAIAQSSFTLPSHASLFTSKYVHTHKADRVERRLGDYEITLAQVLRQNGYKTAAFIYNAPQFAVSFGLNKGFDTYVFGEHERDRKPSFEITVPQALDWIEKHRRDRFFVFLHSNDVHEPYHSVYENFFDPDYKGRLDGEYMASGTPFHNNNLSRTPREVQHIIAHYDGGIKYADEFVGKFIRQIADWGLLEKTIVILLSDHGEILADRGPQFCHGFSVHDEEVHVPLIITHPLFKQKGIKIGAQVQLIDVMPTTLDFLGISPDDLNMEGRSLRGLIEGKEAPGLRDYAYAECLLGESEKDGILNQQLMVRTPSWKLISSIWDIKEGVRGKLSLPMQLHNTYVLTSLGEDGYELYNLENDPDEKNNLIDYDFKDAKTELLKKMISIFK